MFFLEQFGFEFADFSGVSVLEFVCVGIEILLVMGESVNLLSFDCESVNEFITINVVQNFVLFDFFF